MTHTCCSGTMCMLTCAAIAVAYLLGSSALLWLTWNRVVASLAKVKPAKYWQALLLLTTICALCAPRYYMAKGGCHRGGGHDCAGEKGASHPPCPYEAGDKHGEDEPAKPAKKYARPSCARVFPRL